MARKKETPKIHVLDALASIEAQWQALMLLRAEAQSVHDILTDSAPIRDDVRRLHAGMLKTALDRCAVFDGEE